MSIKFISASGGGTAATTTFTPADTISATDVQAAIVEALYDARSYADAVASGLDIKNSVRCATDAALPANTRIGNVLTAAVSGMLPTIDTSCVLRLGDRLLVKTEVAAENNGIYVVTSLGSTDTPWVLTRSTDMDGDPEVTSGVWTETVEGAHALKGWVLTTVDPVELNVTPLTFDEFNPFNLAVGAFGTTPDAKGLTVVGNTITAQPADATNPGLLSIAAQTFAGAKRVSQSTLNSTGGSIAVDLSLNNDFTHTTTENTTLAAPTNVVVGQKGRIVFTQGATPRTLAFNEFWKFSNGIKPALTATAGAVDILYYDVYASGAALCAMSGDCK